MNTMNRKTPSPNCKMICLPVGEEHQYTESSDLVCTAANIPKVKENRIYIRVEFRQSIGMNFVSPFQPKREFNVYK